MWYRFIKIIAVIYPLMMIVAAKVVIGEFHEMNIEVKPLAFLLTTAAIGTLLMLRYGLFLSVPIWVVFTFFYLLKIRKIKIRLLDILLDGGFSEEELQGEYNEKWKSKVCLADICGALKNLLLDKMISIGRVETEGERGKETVRRINLTLAGQNQATTYQRLGTAGLTTK